ncbi:MAG: DUF2855 family protein, partial [Mycobacterium sp.]
PTGRRSGGRGRRLHSARHRRSVETFGVYHRALAYDEVGRLPNVAGAVYVDVAGSAEVTDAVRGRLGSRLAASIVVGTEETWRTVAAGQSDPLSAIVIRPGATLR